MLSFKNQLYGSANLTYDNKLPVSDFIRIRAEHDNSQIRQMILGTEDVLIQEIADPDQPGLVDLNLFSDLIDLFIFTPNSEKVND